MEVMNTKNPETAELSYAEVLRGRTGMSTKKGTVDLSDHSTEDLLGGAVQGQERYSLPFGLDWEPLRFVATEEDLTLKDPRGSKPVQGQTTAQVLKEIIEPGISGDSSPQVTEKPLTGRFFKTSPSTPSLLDAGTTENQKALGDGKVKTWADVASSTPSKKKKAKQKGNNSINGTGEGNMNEQGPESPGVVPEKAPDKGKASDENTLHVAEEGKGLDLDSKVEQVIARAIENQERKVEKEKQAMMRVLAKGDATLWEKQFGWDVLITCDGMNWKVHRGILCSESDWFAERLPPKDPDEKSVELDCSSHQREQLAHVLKFMYYKHYDDAFLSWDDPLNGASIHKNVYMFICAASVNCRTMMNFATNAIDDTTDVVEALMPTVHQRHDLARFHEPLCAALDIMFDQGDRPVMGSMRLAMARLVDVSLMYLALSPDFKERFEATWCPWIFLNCVRDNDRFKKLGWLDPLPEREASPLETAMMAIQEGARGVPEIDAEPDASPPRTELKE